MTKLDATLQTVRTELAALPVQLNAAVGAMDAAAGTLAERFGNAADAGAERAAVGLDAGLAPILAALDTAARTIASAGATVSLGADQAIAAVTDRFGAAGSGFEQAATKAGTALARESEAVAARLGAAGNGFEEAAVRAGAAFARESEAAALRFGAAVAPVEAAGAAIGRASVLIAVEITDADPDAVSNSIYKEVVNERDAAQARVTALEERIVSLEELLAQRAEEVVRLERMLATYREQLARLEAQIATNSEVVARLVQESAALRAAIATLEAELAAARADRVSLYLATSDARRAGILRSIQEAMRAVGIDVEIIEEQGVVRLPNDLLFASGSYTIDGGRATAAVGQLGAALARVLPCFTRGPQSRLDASCNPSAAFVEAVFVEGHTDTVPVAGALAAAVIDNLGLSARRAETTYRRLLALEPSLADFASVEDQPVLNVAAYGETRPIRGNTDLSRNRRIDLRILMHTPRSDTLERVQALVAVAR